MTNIKVKEVVVYGGHSMSANGSVNLTLKAQYSELPNSIRMMQLLNNDVDIKAKAPGSRAQAAALSRRRQIKTDSCMSRME